MPTDDERRDVAAKLRCFDFLSAMRIGLARGNVSTGTLQVLGSIVGVDMTSPIECARLFERLADLIDPTDGFDLDTVQRVCFECMEGCDEPEWTLYTTIYDAIVRYKQGESGPTYDHYALLALADEMDAYTKCDDERCGREMPPRVIHDFASRIREALGDCQRGVSGVGCRGASRGPSGQVAGVALVAPREGAGEKE